MNYADIVKEIDNIKERIIEKCRPEKIILFGSYAYGTPGEDSDVDFLVILPFKGKGAYKALEILEKVKPTIPIDLLVRTPYQVSSRIRQNDFFMRKILEKGKVLYEASH